MNSFKLQFWIAFATAFSVFFAIAVLIPVLPLYIHDGLHLGDIAVGIIMGLQATGAIGSRTMVGRLTSSQGIWRTLAFGAALTTLGGFLFLFQSSAFLLGLARLFQGIGEGLAFTAGTTWIVANAPNEKKGQLLSLFGLSLWLGATIGPMIGGLTGSRWGLVPTIWLAILPPLALTIVAFLQKYEPLAGLNHAKTTFEWIPSESVIPGTTLALASTGFVAISTFGALSFASRDWPHGSWMVVAFGMGFVLMRVVGGHWIDRYSSSQVARVSATVSTLGLLAVALAPAWQWSVLGALLGGSGLALMYPALAIESVRGVDPSRHGNVLGWYTAFWDLSLLGSNFFFGWLASSQGYAAVYLVSALASGLCILFVSVRARVASTPVSSQ